MNISFEGKTAVVTGGSRGIGKQIALDFAKNGANVWIGNTRAADAAAAVAEFEKYGTRCGYTVTDIADTRQVARLMDDAAENCGGRIDIVVNCAGAMITGSLLKATDEQVRRTVDVNMIGMFNVVKAALERMIPNRYGKIVVISSISGRRGANIQGHYCATKAACINFAQSAALEGAPYGINVNTVCPGIVKTDMFDEILKEGSQRFGISKEEEWAKYVAAVPQGRPQTAEDIAAVTMFLCSEYAAAINAQAINVDGGTTLN